MKSKGISNIYTKKFSKEFSLCAKGIGLLLLIVHHVLNTKYPYKSLLIGENYNYMSYVVSIAKVCVYIFFIISGYGLAKSFGEKRYNLIETFSFVMRHVVKLYSMYWIVFVTSILMGELVGKSLLFVYSKEFWRNLILDFLGIAYLTGTPTCMRTWWYFSMSLLYYAIFPMVWVLMKKAGKANIILFLICAIASRFYIGFRVWFLYFIPFLMGIVIALNDLFEKMNAWLSFSKKTRVLKGIIYAGVIVNYCIFRIKIMSSDMFYYRWDWIFGFFIICIVFEYLTPQSVCGRVLARLGKNSGNIFLFHGFLYALYFTSIIYSLRWAIFVYIECVVLFWGLSELLELTKRKMNYSHLFQKLEDKLY